MRKILAVLVALGGCAGRPQSPAEQRTLLDDANLTVDAMRARDPSLDPLLAAFAGYAVFPDVGAVGALVAGGAHGRGVLYQQGRPIGYVDLQQGSVGPQLGGETYSELLILQDDRDVARLKAGEFRLGADLSATVLTDGVAASTRFARGASVFVMPRGGAMAGIAVSGQRIRFEPPAG